MARSHTVECVLHITESCPTTLCSLFIEHVSIEYHTLLSVSHTPLSYVQPHCAHCSLSMSVLSITHTVECVTDTTELCPTLCTHCCVSMSVLSITHTVECVTHTTELCPTHCTHCWVSVGVEYYTHCWVCHTYHWVMSSHTVHTVEQACQCCVSHTLCCTHHWIMSSPTVHTAECTCQPHYTHCWVSVSVLSITVECVTHHFFNIQPHCTHCWVNMWVLSISQTVEYHYQLHMPLNYVQSHTHCWVCVGVQYTLLSMLHTHNHYIFNPLYTLLSECVGVVHTIECVT